MGSPVGILDEDSDQDYVQTRMKIARKALNELADEYMACLEILEDTLPTRLDPDSVDAAKIRMRMADIECFFRKIGSNIRRYAEV